MKTFYEWLVRLRENPEQPGQPPTPHYRTSGQHPSGQTKKIATSYSNAQPDVEDLPFAEPYHADEDENGLMPHLDDDDTSDEYGSRDSRERMVRTFDGIIDKYANFSPTANRRHPAHGADDPDSFLGDLAVVASPGSKKPAGTSAVEEVMQHPWGEQFLDYLEEKGVAVIRDVIGFNKMPMVIAAKNMALARHIKNLFDNVNAGRMQLPQFHYQYGLALGYPPSEVTRWVKTNFPDFDQTG